MKKINYLFLVLFGFIAISCNKENNSTNDLVGGILPRRTIGLTAPEYLSIAYGSKNELSDKEAEKILSDFISDKETKNTISTFELRKKTEVRLKGASTRSAKPDADQIVFYEYEVKRDLNHAGFALVCGDKRFPVLLALSDLGIENESSKMMLSNAKKQALSHIVQIKHFEDSLREKTFNKIRIIQNSPSNNLINFDDIKDKIFVHNDSQTKGWSVNPAGTLRVKVGPLTSTKWNQTSPYNLKAPSTIGTSEDGLFPGYDNRYPAGCVVIAMAQLAAYYKPSTNIPGLNWGLASTASVTDKTSVEAEQIGNLIGAIATGSSTTYSHLGGSTNTQNARNFMKTWGIVMDNERPCVFQAMKSSLDMLRLVYVTGAGRRVFRSGFNASGRHAWIIDGYQIRSRDTRMILKQYNVYCHCNFGWGGNSDGWYLFDTAGTISFSCNDAFVEYDIFDYDLKCYPNVRK